MQILSLYYNSSGCVYFKITGQGRNMVQDSRQDRWKWTKRNIASKVTLLKRSCAPAVMIPSSEGSQEHFVVPRRWVTQRQCTRNGIRGKSGCMTERERGGGGPKGAEERCITMSLMTFTLRLMLVRWRNETDKQQARNKREMHKKSDHLKRYRYKDTSQMYLKQGYL